MNPRLKSLLQKWNIYHPLHSRYRTLRSALAIRYYRSTYRKFKGPGFTCNFCDATYKKFIPDYPSRDIRAAIDDNHVIAGYGENVFCPNCLSKNRERLIKDVFQTHLSADNKKILHFSPERRLHAFLQTTATVTTADTAPGFYRAIDPTIQYADATRLPFPDKSFGIVIANHILEHIPDDRKAMQEIRRVLDDQGVAILQVPYSTTLPTTIEEPSIDDPARQAALFGQRDHVRIYALQDYIERIRKTGFRIRMLTPDDLIPFRIHAIQENESVILGYKH